MITETMPKYENAILLDKHHCFATPKQFIELSCGFLDICSLLQNTCFNMVKVTKYKGKYSDMQLDIEL